MITKTHKPATLLLPHTGAFRGLGVAVKRAKKYMTKKRVLVITGASAVLLVSAMAASFFWPRQVNFSYAGGNCFTQPVVLPNLVSKKTSASYTAKPVASFSIAGYPLFARTTCVTPSDAPKENAVETIPFGMAFLQKDIKVSTGSFPTLASEAALAEPVPTLDPFVVKLDSADQVFEYQLVVAGKTQPCDKKGSELSCDVAELGLAQSATYDFALERMFKDESAGMLFAAPLPTVQAVYVMGSTIAPGQKVFDTPTEMTLTLNRPAVSMENAHLYIATSNGREKVAATATLQDNLVTVRFDNPLPRSALFELAIENIKAEDGGYLIAPLLLNFTTSGGPKVAGVNIGTYKVSTTGNIVITFDSPIATGQALGDFIRLEVGGSPVGVSLSLKNNVVTITPNGALPRCTALTVSVLNGLKNSYGIAGGSAWQYKSRTICQTVFSIGKSVQGRSITAYSFGNGPSKIIFVGTTHGDEKSSTATLNSFIDSLEANYGNIPAHRTVIVIPNLNPDGYAASRRTNANNVDLNRNFPANDWKQGVTMPDGTFNPNGGGSNPLSEPESAAVASYVLSQNPRLVLTYHAAVGVVIPNFSDDSEALAKIYDQKSNLGYSSGAGLFDYDTTGAFEDWLRDKHGIPTLLIELWTKSSNEYSKNQNAMWHMATMP